MNQISSFTKILEKKLEAEDIILYEYNGPFTQKIVKEYAFHINKLTASNKIAQRRLFYVFVELAQNVGFYSDHRTLVGNKEYGIGSLIIYENKKSYGFIIGNYIVENALKVLEQKCEIINNLDRESLREFKIYQRNLIPGTNGGAHIGLIMTALTTRKKIEMDTYSIKNNDNFFSINVKISKEEE